MIYVLMAASQIQHISVYFMERKIKEVLLAALCLSLSLCASVFYTRVWLCVLSLDFNFKHVQSRCMGEREGEEKGEQVEECTCWL